MNLITASTLAPVLIGNTEIDEWCSSLNYLLPLYEINTPSRIAAFISQTAHESGGYKILKENLNYSAKGLATVWPKRYSVPGSKPPAPNAVALKIARNPAAIANLTYANRMGNGDEQSGDGWKFCGRGLIQLTGRENYTKFGQTIGKTAEEVASFLETKDGAVESACWYWTVNKLNQYADKGDIVGLTKRINGGTVGLEDRKAKYTKLMELLRKA